MSADKELLGVRDHTRRAIRHSGAERLVLHWNGSSWTRETTPSPSGGPKLYGAAAAAPSTVWGVGYRYNQRVFGNRTFTIRTTNG